MRMWKVKVRRQMDVTVTVEVASDTEDGARGRAQFDLGEVDTHDVKNSVISAEEMSPGFEDLLPKTIDNWQLYKEKGAGFAARKLTEALKKATVEIEKLFKTHGPGGSKDLYYAKAFEIMNPVRDKVGHGAGDTEIRHVIYDYVDRVIKRLRM